MHDEHHRRGAAALGEGLGDRGEGAQALAAAAVLFGHAHAEQFGPERRDALARKAAARVDLARVLFQDAAGQRAGALLVGINRGHGHSSSVRDDRSIGISGEERMGSMPDS